MAIVRRIKHVSRFMRARCVLGDMIVRVEYLWIEGVGDKVVKKGKGIFS